MFNLDDCFALITSRSGKIFAKKLDEQLSSHGTPRTQWIAMYYIYTSDKITQKGLADKMQIKEPTVARMLQKMELDGLLSRDSNAKDKRIKSLKLTDKGSKEFFRLLPIVENFKDNTISDISDQDLDTFKKVLNKMIENTINS